MYKGKEHKVDIMIYYYYQFIIGEDFISYYIHRYIVFYSDFGTEPDRKDEYIEWYR